MRAMVLEQTGQPLQLQQRPEPLPGPGQVQVKVSACGVCRTDLHVVDGDLSEARLPIIPGHEIVGTISALGEGVDNFQIGERVGYPLFMKPYDGGGWVGVTKIDDGEALEAAPAHAHQAQAHRILEQAFFVRATRFG